jgi:hypothetical protein
MFCSMISARARFPSVRTSLTPILDHNVYLGDWTFGDSLETQSTTVSDRVRSFHKNIHATGVVIKSIYTREHAASDIQIEVRVKGQRLTTYIDDCSCILRNVLWLQVWFCYSGYLFVGTAKSAVKCVDVGLVSSAIVRTIKVWRLWVDPKSSVCVKGVAAEGTSIY